MQNLPQQPKRIETGAVQFGDDWPGVFIRGDNAMYYAILLQNVLKTGGSEFERGMLVRLYDELRSCAVGPAQAMFPDLRSKD